MLTNKAFIFDMDGVMLDSESYWQKENRIFPEISKQTMGQSMKNIYQIALKHGYNHPYAQFFKAYDQQAVKIYSRAPLTSNLPQLFQKLIKAHFRLGLVSASPIKWINYVLARLPQPNIFNVIISINDSDLPSKPAPDGYLEAMKQLHVNPAETIILEDSGYGVQSAKASGAYTICLTEHWPKNYSAPGADRYIKNLVQLNLNPIKLQIFPT